jgi:hypothetical protein
MAHLSRFSGISAPGVLEMAPLALRASGRRSRLISFSRKEVFLEKEALRSGACPPADYGDRLREPQSDLCCFP